MMQGGDINALDVRDSSVAKFGYDVVADHLGVLALCSRFAVCRDVFLNEAVGQLFNRWRVGVGKRVAFEVEASPGGGDVFGGPGTRGGGGNGSVGTDGRFDGAAPRSRYLTM